MHTSGACACHDGKGEASAACQKSRRRQFPWLVQELVVQRKMVDMLLLETRKLLTRSGKVQPSQRVVHKRNIRDMNHCIFSNTIQLCTATSSKSQNQLLIRTYHQRTTRRVLTTTCSSFLANGLSVNIKHPTTMCAPSATLLSDSWPTLSHWASIALLLCPI